MVSNVFLIKGNEGTHHSIRITPAKYKCSDKYLGGGVGEGGGANCFSIGSFLVVFQGWTIFFISTWEKKNYFFIQENILTHKKILLQNGLLWYYCIANIIKWTIYLYKVTFHPSVRSCVCLSVIPSVYRMINCDTIYLSLCTLPASPNLFRGTQRM